jgi:hypothetical protein
MLEEHLPNDNSPNTKTTNLCEFFSSFWHKNLATIDLFHLLEQSYCSLALVGRVEWCDSKNYYLE